MVEKDRSLICNKAYLYTLDISAIPVLRSLTHLPIMIDPSHATGKSEFVSTRGISTIGTENRDKRYYMNNTKVFKR